MNPEGLEKTSSLHDDPLEPKAGGHLGEYSDYPKRFNPEEKSVITRARQFGIDLKEACEILGVEQNGLSWEDYTRLIGEAIRERYDTIVASVFDQYMLPSTENPDADKRKQEMFQLFGKYKRVEETCGVHLIRQKTDFRESGNLVLGLEAGAHLINSLADINELQDHGVRLFGLQYDKGTPLADTNGLTSFGKEAVRYLFDHNLIVDLAHSGLKTRKGVMELAKDLDKGYLVAYTHGSTEDDVMEPWRGRMGERLLKQEEIAQLTKMGGIIGLGVTRPFFSSTRGVAERINTIAQLDRGIDSLAIGSDFGGVPSTLLNEIKSPEDLKKLADALSGEFGLSDEDILRILRKNAREWIQRAID